MRVTRAQFPILFPARRRRGSLLVIAMVICFGLISVSVYYANAIRLEYLAAENLKAGLQAEQAIAGAARYIAYVLAAQDELTPGIPPIVELGDYVAENVPVGEATFWLVGRDPDDAFENEEPVFGLIDEASKLNINTAPLEVIEMLPGMTYELAAAIVDWRDADQELTPDGAEASEYEQSGLGYSVKDSDFETPEELRLVMGMDTEFLYGEDVNRNGVLDPNEDDGDLSWPPDNADGVLDAGLLEYVTTFTRERNVRPDDGEPAINIRSNTAQQDLYELISERISQQRAEEIIEVIGSDLSDILSPLEFYVASTMSEEDFREIEDALSVTSNDYRVGLVNVNTAPVEVLACLPGMDTTMAERLVDARASIPLEERDTVAWVADVLQATTCADIGPYITARSYQYSADIVAVGANGRGFRRCLMVFDVEEGVVRVIYRRDLTRHGWPLGQALREEIRFGT